MCAFQSGLFSHAHPHHNFLSYILMFNRMRSGGWWLLSVVPADRRVKYVYLTADLWMDFLHFRHRAREMSPRFEAREETPRLVSAAVPLLRAGGGRRPGEGPLAPASARGLSLRLAQSVSVSRVQQIPASLGPASSGQPGPRPTHQTFIRVLPSS